MAVRRRVLARKPRPTTPRYVPLGDQMTAIAARMTDIELATSAILEILVALRLASIEAQMALAELAAARAVAPPFLPRQRRPTVAARHRQ